MQGDSDKVCQRNCWLIAGGAGLLVAVLLSFVAQYPFGTALFFGIMLFALGGAFLSWAFCAGRSATETGRQVEAAQTVAAPLTPSGARPLAEPLPPAPPEGQMNSAQAEPAPAPAAPTMAVSAPADVHRTPNATRKPRSAGAKPSTTPAARTGAARRKPAAPRMKAPAEKAPRAAGLDAAISKTKDEDPAPATTPFLDVPRGGRADDLKEIVGIGPVLERLLNSIGVWHFDQIAAWKARDIALVDGKMEGFKGRITRDEWVKQARVLAKGRKV